MADNIEEIPRGKELAIAMKAVDQAVMNGYKFRDAIPVLNTDATTNDVAWSCYYAVNALLMILTQIQMSLADLAARGFFDDNAMELAMHVLDQLKETKNGGTK